MAYDKVVESAVLDAGLTSIADEIRAKGGTTDTMSFPDGMVNAIAAIETGGSSVSTWKNVQQIVQRGDGAKVFPVGTQFQVSTQSYGTLLFDVVAHDHHKNPNDETAHTMTLLMHDVIPNMEFDAAELLWVNTTGTDLAADKYQIQLYKSYSSTYDDSSGTDDNYIFSTKKPIPTGGGFYQRKIGTDFNKSGAYNPGVSVTTVDSNGEEIESVSLYKTSGGTLIGFANIYANGARIGSLNSTYCNAYGSNNWKYSNVRQWLNSSGAANEWWSKQTIFDLPPTYANMPGFLCDLDPEFVEVLGEIDTTTNYNTFYEVDGVLTGSYTVRDKMFLISTAECNTDSNYAASTDSVLDYYSGSSNGDSDLIKYKYNNATYAFSWWLRGVYGMLASNKYISLNGVLNSSSPSSKMGVAAACVIY